MKISFKLLLASALIMSAGQLPAKSFSPPHINQARPPQTQQVAEFTQINLSGLITTLSLRA
nr:hypothetical protein [uncultured Mucilaginibacter sp.]